MPYDNIDLRATTRLAGLDIEIVHRRSPEGDREEVSINLQAVPSFEAFRRQPTHLYFGPKLPG